MTIQEIIDREVAKVFVCEAEPGHNCCCAAEPKGHHDPQCRYIFRDEARAACLAVAKAVVEECASTAEACEEHLDHETSFDTWQAVFKRRISRTIRALAAQGPGGEEGK